MFWGLLWCVCFLLRLRCGCMSLLAIGNFVGGYALFAAIVYVVCCLPGGFGFLWVWFIMNIVVCRVGGCVLLLRIECAVVVVMVLRLLVFCCGFTVHVSGLRLRFVL